MLDAPVSLAPASSGAMLDPMLTVHLPADLSSQIQARASASGVSSDDVVADALRREATARRLFGDLLDAAGGEFDEDEVMALAVALTRQVRRERAGS